MPAILCLPLDDSAHGGSLSAYMSGVSARPSHLKKSKKRAVLKAKSAIDATIEELKVGAVLFCLSLAPNRSSI